MSRHRAQPALRLYAAAVVAIASGEHDAVIHGQDPPEAERGAAAANNGEAGAPRIDISQNSDIINLMNILPILKALANEKRLNILQWLNEPAKHFQSSHCDVSKDGVCVGLIEEKSGLSQSTVSQYLMILQQAGLITMERRGQWTYCKRNPKAMKQFIKQLANL